MITEDYVSFEVAKLLKEKGFDSEDIGEYGGFYSERCYEPGHGIKTLSGQEVGIVYDDLTNSELDYDEYLRPTLQMTMKFLYKKYGIYITILQVEASTVTMEQEYFFYRIQKNRKNVGIFTDKFKEPEQAADSAIKYALENLI